MTSQQAAIVSKVWNYCNVLRDDGVSYGDYVEQLTYLIFLKMADEQSKPPLNRPSHIPDGYDWQSLLKLDGAALEDHYRRLLQELSTQPNTLGKIFRKSQNRIQDPAKLKRLVELIDSETWIGLDVDIKGDIYEGLLEKNAEDVKSGAGQYFTPRALIKAIVEVMRPEPGMKVCDPACGTGGFLLAAHDYIASFPLDWGQKQFLETEALQGTDIVDGVVRLCIMNLYLHGIQGHIETGDSLVSNPGRRYQMVLTNPPFGRKSSVTITNGDGQGERDSLTYEREDFWATTSNKQLNFLQHAKTLLETDGKAAIVVPDNVLFEAGAGETIRRKLLQECDVHTLLRLPTGIFYRPGVKANVLFFDNRPGREEPWTDHLWIYDFRTNKHFTLKTNPLKYEHLDEFIACFNADNRHDRTESERFRSFSYDELIKRDKVNLDITWLRDESLEDTDNLPEPEVIAREIAENLQAALEQISSIQTELESKQMTEGINALGVQEA